MSKFGFWDVDTQADFMLPDGKLYVPGAEKIIPALKRLYGFARKNKITVVATADAHSPADAELETWPPHCMIGTPGQKKIKETRLKGQILLEKNENDAFSNPRAAETVRKSGLSHWIVFGVATDYCVRCAVLGLLKLGCRVTVVSDAIRGVTDEAARQAVVEMQQAGAAFQSADAVLRNLSPASRRKRTAKEIA